MSATRNGTPARAYFSTPVMTMPRMNTRWKIANRIDRDEQGHDVARLDQVRLRVVDALEAGQADLERLDVVVAGR